MSVQAKAASIRELLDAVEAAYLDMAAAKDKADKDASVEEIRVRLLRGHKDKQSAIIAQQDVSLVKLRQQVHGLNEANTKLRTSKAKLNELAESDRKCIDKLSNENDELEDQAKDQAKRITELSQANEALIGQLAGLQQYSSESEREVHKLKKELQLRIPEGWRSEIERLNELASGRAATIARLEEEADRRGHRIRVYEERAARAEGEAARIRQQVERAVGLAK